MLMILRGLIVFNKCVPISIANQKKLKLKKRIKTENL